MKNILVPTDFSENAANALTYAIQLVKFVKGRLLLFHNAEIPPNFAGNNIFTAGDLTMGMNAAYPGGVFPNQELEQLQQDNLNQLASRVRQDMGSNFPVDTFYMYGSLTDNLNEIVRKEQVDLVVMGTTGASTFLERFIGTNTASVIKRTQVPVLAIPAEATFTLPHKIAYAADLELEEDIFLNQLLNFAQPYGANITLVHIKSENQVDIINDELIQEELRQKYPNQQLQLLERPGKTVALGLENYIREVGSDLLAVGIHEHSFIYTLFHSSVPEQLIFHTTVPVLALPEKPINF